MTRFDTKRTVTDCSPDVSLWFCPIDGQNKKSPGDERGWPRVKLSKKSCVWEDLWCAEGHALTGLPPPPSLCLSSWVCRRVPGDCAHNLQQIENEKKSHIKMINRGGDLRAWWLRRWMHSPVSPSPFPWLTHGFQMLCFVGSPPNQNGEKPDIKTTNREILLGRAREGGNNLIELPNCCRCPQDPENGADVGDASGWRRIAGRCMRWKRREINPRERDGRNEMNRCLE